MNNINSMNKIENFLTTEELEKLNEFFEKIYYENDLIRYSNCFDYKEGRINLFHVIDLINEYDLKININYKFWGVQWIQKQIINWTT